MQYSPKITKLNFNPPKNNYSNHQTSTSPHQLKQNYTITKSNRSNQLLNPKTQYKLKAENINRQNIKNTHDQIIMQWEVILIKDQFQITKKEVFNSLQQIQGKIRDEKARLQFLKNQDNEDRYLQNEESQRYISKVSEIRKTKCDLDFQSNIYNLAIGQIILMQYQNNQQTQRSQIKMRNNKKVVERIFEDKEIQCKIQQQNLLISKVYEQKSKLQQEIIKLKKKIQQLQNEKVYQLQNNYITNQVNKNQIVNQKTNRIQQNINFIQSQKKQASDKKFRTSIKSNPKKIQNRYPQQNQLLNNQSTKPLLKLLVDGGSPIINKSKQNNKDKKQNIDIPVKIGLKNMQFPKLPENLQPQKSSKQLIQLGKKTFQIFGIKYKQNQIFNFKKFKNCVYFNFSNYHIVWYYNGKFYIGGWKNNQGEGQKQGFGIQYIPQKYIYQGNFKQGRRNGIGTIKYQNGDKYTGSWLDGIRNGNGKWEEITGLVYDGQWKQGKKQGFGKQIISLNQIYQGMFFRNIKHGYGKQIFKNGDSYHGQYMMGKFSGKGCYKWANGAYYDGQFYNGSRNGNGFWRSSNLSPCDSYQGEYVNDKKCGKGKYNWQNGSSYEGQFLNDLKHGQGTLRFFGGKVLRAIWENGVAKKKLYSEQQQMYKETKKPPRSYSAVKKQEIQGISRRFRVDSNKNRLNLNIQQTHQIQFLKQTPYRKMQYNNSNLQFADL